MTTPILDQTRGEVASAGAIDAGDRFGWLELARQQSQALAEGEARGVRPWRWQALADGEARKRGRFFLWFVLRPSWAAVTILVLLAGGVTLGAYVARRSAPPAKTAPAAKPAPRPQRAVVAPVKAPTLPTTVEPAEVVEAREELAPEPKRPGAAVSKAPSRPAPAETIILGPDDTDGAGEMIIVPRPQKKLKPLFTPEDYKKKGRRGTRF